MKKLILILALIIPQQLFAAFQYTEVGARPVGMNGAFSAVADDANSVVYNVAGMGKITRAEVSAIYTSLNPGLNDNLGAGGVVYVHPIPVIGTIGVSDIEFSSSLYGERVFSLSYGREVPYMRNMYLGMSLKYLSKSYVTNAYTRFDPTFTEKTAAGGVGIDFGVLYTLPELLNLSFALTGKNVNQPDIALKKHDIVPAEYRVGVGCKIQELTLDVDGVVKTNSNNDYRVLVGAEYLLLNRTAGLRAGLGAGNNEYYNIALGIGWRLVIMKMVESSIDYSFNYNPVSLIGGGKHQVSLAFKF
ncbi:MAG: hypothetical protein WC955_01360 [Elusimicrobiota bacterium]